MPSVAFERVRAKIKTEAARILQSELKDPRMGFVTVVDVDLSRDFRHATIHISILAEHEGEERRILQALKSAKGYVQKTIAGRLRTRTTPLIELRLEREAREKAAAGEGPEDEGPKDE